MKLKQYPGLSEYLITATGGVLKATDFSQVHLTPQKNYKLTTDERAPISFGIGSVNGKAPKLVRRFTVEQVVKMFEDLKSVVLEHEEKVSELPAPTEEKVDIPKVKKSKRPATKVKRDGVQIELKTKDTLLDPGATYQAYVRTIPNPHPETLSRDGGKTIINFKQYVDGLHFPFYIINSVPFQSARKASDELKVSINTILKKCKANKDGFFYIEK